MKEDASKKDPQPQDRQEIKSSDIPNAHAAGDGAMGRNDEKIEEPNGPAGEKEKKGSESSTY